MVVAQLGRLVRLVPTCANLGCFNRFQLFVPHFVWEGHLTGSTSGATVTPQLQTKMIQSWVLWMCVYLRNVDNCGETWACWKEM